MAEVAIVDASPLIYLAKADYLELLQLAADRIMVPSAVAGELERHPVDAAVRALRDTAWLSVVEPHEVPPAVLAWDLGPGETAVVALALAEADAVAALDDRAARRCAISFQVTVRGTVGLALLARQRGLVPSARAVLERLRQAGMYLSEATLTKALTLVGEA